MICNATHAKQTVFDINQCSEFRQTLDANPPAAVHATTLLLSLLIGIAVAWSALTQADLVVVARGRIRPTSNPTQVFVASDTRLLGRVTAVEFTEGERVEKGQVLIRLDAQLIENEISRNQKAMQAARAELDRIEHLDLLLQQEYQAAQAKAEAELQTAIRKIEAAHKRRDSAICQAQTDVAQARSQAERHRLLAEKKAVSEAAYEDHATKYKQAREKLRIAQLPVEDGEIEVLTRNQQVIERDYQVRLGELDARRVRKNGEIRAAEEELASLTLRKKNAEILAPTDGMVVAGKIHVGDVLESGKAVVEIAQVDGFHFEVNVTSKQIGNLSVGQPARIKFTAFDHQEYGTAAGRIVFVSPDSIAANSTVQPTQDFAYAVRIRLENERVTKGAKSGALKLGMGGVAEIIAARESLLKIFTKNLRNTISFG